MPIIVIQGRFLLALAVVLAAAAFVLVSLKDEGGEGDTVGVTTDLVAHPRWPLRWEGNESVVFQMWVGVTTVRLDGTVIAATRSPEAPLEGIGIHVEDDARFAQWRAWNGGRYLLADPDQKCGPPLIPSPDGRYLACKRTITDRGHETSEAFGAVIRIR